MIIPLNIALVILVVCSAYFLWRLHKEIWDWKLFDHHSSREFTMNLSTRQSLGIFKHTPGIVAVDVRPPAQFEKSHLPDALNAPFENNQLDAAALESLDHTTPLLVYCQGGFRSRKALKAIKEHGFHSIYHINRGLIMWRLFSGPLSQKDPEEQ